MSHYSAQRRAGHGRDALSVEEIHHRWKSTTFGEVGWVALLTTVPGLIESILDSMAEVTAREVSAGRLILDDHGRKIKRVSGTESVRH